MPARITPQGIVVTLYDFQSEQWQSELRRVGVGELLFNIEIQPEVCLGDILDLCVQNDELIACLGKATFCDIRELQARPRTIGESFVVHPSLVDERAGENGRPAEFIELSKWMMLTPRYEPGDKDYPEPNGPQRARVHYEFSAGRNDQDRRDSIAVSAIGLASEPLSGPLDVNFGALVSLPFKLAATMYVHSDEGKSIVAEATYTLWEVLSALFFTLGDPPQLMNAQLPEIETQEYLRKIFGDPGWSE